MTRSQRILLIVGLLGLAAYLHVRHCQWAINTVAVGTSGRDGQPALTHLIVGTHNKDEIRQARNAFEADLESERQRIAAEASTDVLSETAEQRAERKRSLIAEYRALGSQVFIPPTDLRATGLFTRAGINHRAGELLGVILPLALALGAAILLLAWRRAERRVHGLCLKCGYDLYGDSDSPRQRCPECGRVRAH